MGVKETEGNELAESDLPDLDGEAGLRLQQTLARPQGELPGRRAQALLHHLSQRQKTQATDGGRALCAAMQLTSCDSRTSDDYTA